MGFFQNCSKIASKETYEEVLFCWFSASCRSQVNSILLKNNYTESNMPQNYVFTIFLQNVRMTIKPLKIAAKISFLSTKINLNIQNLKIMPYNQKKNADSTWCVIFAVQYTKISGMNISRSHRIKCVWSLTIKHIFIWCIVNKQNNISVQMQTFAKYMILKIFMQLNFERYIEKLKISCRNFLFMIWSIFSYPRNIALNPIRSLI